MTQCHTQISHENLPVQLKLENIIINLPLWIGLKWGDSFEHLCTCSNIDFGSFLTNKNVTDCSFKKSQSEQV